MTHWTLHRNVLRESKAPPEAYETLAQDHDRGTYVKYCKEYDYIVALGWPITWVTVVRVLLLTHCSTLTETQPRRTFLR